MKNLNLSLSEDEHHDFLNFLENAMYSEDPIINNTIAEIILMKIEE